MSTASTAPSSPTRGVSGLDPICSLLANPRRPCRAASPVEIYHAANPVAEMSAGREDLLEALGFPLPVQQQLPPGTGGGQRVALHPEHSG